MLCVRLKVSIAAVAAFNLVALLSAQMQPHARLDGELLPIVTCSSEYLNVLHNGRKRQTPRGEYEVRPAAAFGEGFVKIENERSDLDPLRDASAKERADPGAIRFRYRAELIAQQALSDCYALLTFTSQGSVGTHLIPVGRLAAGRAKEVEVKLPAQVDSVGSLHVFSDGMEVRSTRHAEPYDLRAYYAELVKDVHALSAAELLKFEDVHPHVLSPDGRMLASVRKKAAKKVLIAYDLASMKLLAEKPVAEADDFVGGLTWISDHELVFVAEDDYRDERSDFALQLLDTRAGEVRKLLDDTRSVICSVPPKHEVLVLKRARPRQASWFVKYDVRTGKTFDVEETSYGYYGFDQQGNARLRTKEDEGNVVHYCRPTPTSPWKKIDEIVKQPGLKFSYASAELLDRVVDVHSVGPDGDILYISTRLGTDRFELAAFSMSEGVIKQTIAKHPRYDLTIGDGGMAQLLFAKNSSRLIGLVYESQKPQVVWLDPGFAAVQKNIDRTFPDHVNLPVDWSEDGSTFIYFSASDRDPGTYLVYRPLESRLIPLLKLGERLEGRELAVTTAFELVARDGQKIPAYVTRPPGESSKPRPLILDVHGGPMRRDSWGFNATNQFFASRGYLVLQVNYRGSSGYGANFQNAGLRARLDTVVLDDIADGVKHLIERGEADPARVGIMGASFGGWATYVSLAKYPELYRAGVAISAVSNWRKTLRDDRGVFDNRGAFAFWKTLLDRQDFAESEKFIDPSLRASEILQPVLIMHGEWDTVVHATEAKLMLEALRKHNQQVRARSFPRASHSYWSYEDRVIMLNEMAAFFEQHLQPATPEN